MKTTNPALSLNEYRILNNEFRISNVNPSGEY